MPIRESLDAYKGLSQFKYDVDVVVRLASKLKPRVVVLSGEQLQEDGSHRFALERWQSFRDHAMKAMRARFGKAVKSGRKPIEAPKGKIPAGADLVVTLSYKEGIWFYLPDEGRWVVSFPEQHHQRRLKKEKATNERFKRTIRMFNREGKREVLGMDVGSSKDGAFWLAVLRSLTALGLGGGQLVTSDRPSGVEDAIATVFPGAF